MSSENLTGTILVVDDDDDIRAVLKDRLELMRYQVLDASSGARALELLETHDIQMVLLDVVMPEMDGLTVLREMRRRGLDVTVLMITAYATVERAVQAMKQGAYDFIPKPFEPDHIALTVGKALERESLKRGLGVLAEELDDRHRLIIGSSAAMTRALEVARKAAATRSTILLLGESGTGKEIFARAIHRWSDRSAHPFIAVNCVGLTQDLLESTLFGHEKGAFTGAHQMRKGKMELAHGGTVFLDEIGDMAPDIQSKLLRFLQEREFERVGGTRAVHVDVKVIAATNRNLAESVKEGRFRDDLFYRLNVIPIGLPPLRERREDIAELARFFMQRFSRETKKPFVEISQDALDSFLSYDWPGNVRELANTIERAVVLGRGPKMTLEDLPAAIVRRDAARPSGRSYSKNIEAYRRQLIQAALTESNGNRAAAAKALGLQRTYLSRLIRTLRIS